MLHTCRIARLVATPRQIQVRHAHKMSITLEYTPDRAAELKENMQSVLSEIESAASSSSRQPARLVPISKLKPASDIQALYDAGYRHFGENYIQEMADKAEALPKDIQWHFVGALQSNKSKIAAGIPNLFVLETLSSIKVADLLQKSLSPNRTFPLNVYLQVNTSGEDAKSGLPPLNASSEGSSDLVDLAVHVIEQCPGLKLLGIMTIGAWDASHDTSKPNPDFTRLTETREHLTRLLKDKGHEVGDLELSMGMSADFAQAVKEGSSSVRVGTRIFGERPKKSGA